MNLKSTKRTLYSKIKKISLILGMGILLLMPVFHTEAKITPPNFEKHFAKPLIE